MIRAASLIQLLCDTFALPLTEGERSALSTKLDTIARRWLRSAEDELASLLFIECHEESQSKKLDYIGLRRVIDRVAKRVYRSESRSRIVSGISEAVEDTSPAQQDLDTAGVLAGFIQHLQQSSDAREVLIFQLLFIDKESMANVCRIAGVKKTTVYDTKARLIAAFNDYLSR